ncbi:MAG: VWA domain-containing protein [Candidatus Aminicenantes bacterium]|nr:VWA domain-containing protein [Candidatus Aminicenantes bacterium]
MSAWLLALWLLSGSVHLQCQTPGFRSESNVVLVDLIVTDQKGNFVADLKPGEVQVFGDGKRQDIRFFRLEGTDRFPTREIQAGVTGNHYVFLVDLQTLTRETVERSKEAIREFLRSEIDPRDYFMLATIGPKLRVVQKFTRNITTLERALDQVSDYPWLPPHLTPLELLHLLARQGDLSCHAIAALSSYLGSLPNRKHVLYFSRGYKLHMSSYTGSFNARSSGSRRSQKATFSLTSKVRSAVDQANRNQVTLHSIDPRGLMTASFVAATYVGVSGLESTHEFLATLSKETAGLLATGENDLLGPIREAYLDGRTYYLLGYVPDHQRKIGKFHEIRVKVRRGGVQVRHRKGYVDQDPLVATQSELANAFKFPDLFNDFQVNLDAVPKNGKLAVRAQIPTKALRFTSEGETNRCVLEIFGIVFDEFDEPIEKGFFLAESVDLEFDAKELAGFRGHETLGPWMEKDSPRKGSYLVVVLRQKLTGELATATVTLGAGGPQNKPLPF